MKARTLKEILKLDPDKSLTHTIRLKNSTYIRTMKHIFAINERAGDKDLRDIITEALVAYLDDYDNERGLLNEKSTKK